MIVLRTVFHWHDVTFPRVAFQCYVHTQHDKQTRDSEDRENARIEFAV